MPPPFNLGLNFTHKVVNLVFFQETKLAEAKSKAGGGDEPDFDALHESWYEMRDLQERIREEVRDLWAVICGQDIIISGNPYWLIHFSFGNLGIETTVKFLDDDGAAEKPIDRINVEEYQARYLDLDPRTEGIIASETPFVQQYAGQTVIRPGHIQISTFKMFGSGIRDDQHLGFGRTNTFLGTYRPRSGSVGASTQNLVTSRPPPEPTTQSAHTPQDDLGEIHDFDDHRIINHGDGLLCGIFALHDSIAEQVPLADIPTGQHPTDEEIYNVAINGSAAQTLRTILPNEVHTRNFTADHLASILYEWGQGPVALQLGIIFGDESWQYFALPADETRPLRRVWILHEGPRTGGHYSGLKRGDADTVLQTVALLVGRMKLNTALTKLLAEYQLQQDRLSAPYTNPESLEDWKKRREKEKEEEKKKKEKGPGTKKQQGKKKRGGSDDEEKEGDDESLTGDEDWTEMTKPQLQAALARRNLPKSGNKPQLIERLIEFEEQDESSEEDSENAPTSEDEEPEVQDEYVHEKDMYPDGHYQRSKDTPAFVKAMEKNLRKRLGIRQKELEKQAHKKQMGELQDGKDEEDGEDEDEEDTHTGNPQRPDAMIPEKEKTPGRRGKQTTKSIPDATGDGGSLGGGVQAKRPRGRPKKGDEKPKADPEKKRKPRVSKKKLHKTDE